MNEGDRDREGERDTLCFRSDTRCDEGDGERPDLDERLELLAFLPPPSTRDLF